MTNHVTEPTVPAATRETSGARRPWTPPRLEALPPLRELTLQSGGAIGGDADAGGGGGTVF